MKFTDYPRITDLDSSSVLLIDGTNGTKTILATGLMRALLDLLPGENHRMFLGNKNLGTAVTAAQKAAIKDGSFKGLFVGDYWVIGGKTWRIADMDYFYGCGDTAFNTHHLVIVPDESLYNASMNTENKTEGGYMGSEMYKTGLANAKQTIKEAFGDMVLSHREFLVNAAVGGYPSAAAWTDSEVELMSEIMVYGNDPFNSLNNATNFAWKHSVAKTQLALFMLSPKRITTRYTYWLRDVVSATRFAFVGNVGGSNCGTASSSAGVRPEFCIG